MMQKKTKEDLGYEEKKQNGKEMLCGADDYYISIVRRNECGR